MPAGSERIVKTVVTAEWEEGQGVVEPLSHIKNKPGLEMPRALVRMSDREVYVPVTNFSDNVEEITGEAVIASIQTIDYIDRERREEKGEASGERKVSEGWETACQGIVSKMDAGLSPWTIEKVGRLIKEFEDIFYECEEKFGRSGELKHTVNVEGSKPMKLPP